MKLYTEEQVKLLLGEHLSEYQIDKRLNDIEHIELPSEEEILKESFTINPPKIQNDYGNDYDDNIQYRDEWLNGARWVIEKLKKNN
jgi:hypothetical protein